MRRWFLVVLCSLCLFTGGCQRGTDDIGSEKNVDSFNLRGKVLAIDKKTWELTIAHDAIPGFMDAMTMSYRTTIRGALDEVQPGDMITARLLVDKDKDGEYHNPRLDRIVIVGQAKPDTAPKKTYNVPSPGEPVPDFALTNQDGKTVHLEDFRKKALLVTFIYTRCPLGDFCPKMSRNFAEIDKALQQDKALYGKTQLLSVSFDPAYDTPKVLKSYGGAYTGKYTAEKFEHWQFAAPRKGDLPKLEGFFNVGVTGTNAALTHSLSTVLIGPDGKIVAWYPGNEWKPGDVVAEMRKTVQGA